MSAGAPTTDCCREAAAEVVSEVHAALGAIKSAADSLTAFAPMLEGVTYTDPDDFLDDPPRNAGEEAIKAAVRLEAEADALLDRVRRIAWTHDLDHAAGRVP